MPQVDRRVSPQQLLERSLVRRRRQSWRCDASVVPTVLVRAGTSLVPLAGGDFETVGKTPAGWALGGGHIVTADDASCTQPARR
jgi:hypothetical protein